MNINLTDVTFNDVDGNYNIINGNTEPELAKFKKWLTAPDPLINHNNARKECHKDTGQWLLEDERYIAWTKKPNSLMWINGISGCGKTIICSTIIENVKTIVKHQPGSGLAYFYFDINDKAKQTSNSLLSSLALSFTAKSKNYLFMEQLYKQHDQLHQPTEDELLDLLMKLLCCFKQAYMVIDALDECDNHHKLFNQVIKVIHEWQLPQLHLLLSSRREQDVIVTMGEYTLAEMSLSAGLIQGDIISYINSVVGKDHRLMEWGHKVQQDVKNALISGANGMFHWVACQVEERKHYPNQEVLSMDKLKCSALQATSVMGNADIVELLLDNGANVNAQTGFYGNAMQAALEKGHVDIVRFLLDNGADINVMNGEYGNALQAASVKGNAEIVALLLEKGAVVNAQGGIYCNALQAASVKGNAEIVSLLLNKGANVNAQGGIFGNALQAASVQGNAETVSLLLDKGAVVNAQGGICCNALQAALVKGNAEIVSLLLNKGANVNAQGGIFGNALQAALEMGYVDIVRLLLDNGAEMNVQNGFYGNALQLASVRGNAEIVSLLLDKGADVNAQGGIYGNALQAALEMGYVDIVRLLLDNGAEINVQNGFYGNALQLASVRGNAEIVSLLLDKGADVNAQGGIYGNALQATLVKGNPEIIALLLEKGAVVNAWGGIYGKALQAASEKGYVDIVQLLLDNRADGEYGNALQDAVVKGNVKIISLLLDKGADVNAQGGMYDNAEIIALLLEKGAVVNAQGRIYGNADFVALLDQGADVDAQGGIYCNALQAASVKGNADLVSPLLNKRADVNSQGGQFGNDLQAASQGWNSETVQMLFKAGADVNAQGGEYGNALQAASQGGHSEVVKLLLERGAYESFQGGKCGNALQAASYQGHKDVVELLLEQRALLPLGNGEEKHNQARLAVQGIPAAGKWFLRKPEFHKWNAGTSASSILWITGISGLGKTIISLVVIEDLRGSKQLAHAALFVYCETSNHAKCNSMAFHNLFSQLLFQLLDDESSAADHLIKLYQMVQCLDIQTLIKNISQDYEKVFVIIDALDECTVSINLLESLPSGWHVFITSLREGLHREAFGVYDRFIISPADNAADIRQLVQMEVEKIKVRNREVTNDIVDALTSGAEGCFLWPIYHMRRLQKVEMEGQIPQSLDSPPRGMVDHFLRALRLTSICRSWEKTKQMLCTTLCATRPMTILELEEVVATVHMQDQLQTSALSGIRDMNCLIDDCSTLLVRVPAKNQNQPGFLIPVHSSLRGFLLGEIVRLSEDPTKYESRPSSLVNEDVARLCLTYLERKLAEYPLEVLAQTSEHPFTRYAVTGCLNHICASEIGTLATDLRAFCSPGSVTFKGLCYLYKRQLGKFATPGVERHLERLDCAHLAVWLDLLVVLQQFSRAGLLVKDNRGLNMHHVAVWLPSTPAIIDYLLDQVETNSLSSDGSAALHIAVSETVNAATIIQRLLKSGANVNAKDEEGQTPLHLLMHEARRALSCMDVLLCNGADVNARDNSSRTPLHLASSAPEYALKRQLNRFTSNLQDSIAESYSKVIHLLLDYGADITSRDEANDTPLHIAAENANAFAVELLLQRGASVTALNNIGCMPIHSAVGRIMPDSSVIRCPFQESHDQALTINYLLDHGSDVNATDQNSQTPLHLAARSLCDIKIFHVLIQKGAAVSTTDDNHATPLHLAAQMTPISNLHDAESQWHFSWAACRQVIEFLVDGGGDSHILHDIADEVCQFLQSNYPGIVTQLNESGYIYKSEPDHPSTTWFKGVMTLLCSEGAIVDSKTSQGYNILRFAMESWASWIFEYHWMLAAREQMDDMSVAVTFLAWSQISTIFLRP